MQTSPEVFEIYTEGSDFTHVRDELEKDFTLATAELTMVPKTTVALDEAAYEKLMNLIDVLEDDDDVSDVHYNAELAQ